MSSHASFILFAGYYYIALACLNGYLCLAMKRAMTKEDNEAWNCLSQRNHWYGIRIPWGGLPCPSLFKLGYSFHMQWTSEQHWVLLNGFRAPYGNCLGSWHQAKEWQFFSPFVFIFCPVLSHIRKPYVPPSFISSMPCAINTLHTTALAADVPFAHSTLDY